MSLPKTVRVVEVGPRDGLQNEPQSLSIETRVEFIKRLADCGILSIEAGSFVRPDRVPQMADSAAVIKNARERLSKSNVQLPALVPNRIGLEKALQVNIGEIAIFAAASETFSQRNINCSISESIKRLEEVTALARQNDILVRGYISCVMGCPYEGSIDLGEVARVAEKLLALGCYEISLGDTIGTGTPEQTARLIEKVKQVVPIEIISMHCHDTYGQALANIFSALQCGVNIVDASVAGLGGCPYAKGASGNVATEDIVYMLNGLQIGHGIDLQKLVSVGRWICEQLQRPVMSKVNIAYD